MNDKLLIRKLGNSNFWHRRNDVVLSDRLISDFEVSIDENFVIVELDGSQSWKYSVENISIQIGANGNIETGFDRYTFKNRLEEIMYTPYLVHNGFTQTQIDAILVLLNSGGTGGSQDLESVLTRGFVTDKKITFVLQIGFSTNESPYVTIDINGLFLKTVNGLSNGSLIKNDNATSNCVFNLPLAPSGGTYSLATTLQLDLKANLLSPNFTGNVKIGSNAFSGNLHILSGGGINSGLKIEALNASAYATIDFVNQTNVISGQFLNTNSGFNNGIFMPNSTYLANYGDSLGLVSTGYIKFVTNGFSNVDEKMRILQNGNIGIGTATPGTKLAVVGLPIFENNANAITGGLSVGDFYRTPIGVLMVRF